VSEVEWGRLRLHILYCIPDVEDPDSSLIVRIVDHTGNRPFSVPVIDQNPKDTTGAPVSNIALTVGIDGVTLRGETTANGRLTVGNTTTIEIAAPPRSSSVTLIPSRTARGVGQM